MTTTTRATEETNAKRPNSLIASLGVANFGIFLVWGSFPSVLLPLLMQDIDPANKEVNLATVTMAGAVVATLAQPMWGFISDRTRSRWGRRLPYLIVLSIAGALALIGISQLNSVLMIVAAWCFVILTVGGAEGILSSVLPDRVPAVYRGVGSAALGLGVMFGALGGQIITARLARSGGILPYVVVAAVLVVAMLCFVFIGGDSDSRDRPRPERIPLRSLLRSLWVSPKQYPNFAWAFWGKFALLLGFNMVQDYQLYILQDHIGLTRDQALSLTPVMAASSLVAMLIAIPLSGWLADRWGRRKPFVALSGLLIGTAAILPFFAPAPQTMIAFSVVGGIGFGIFRAVDLALITLVLPDPDDAAKDLGVAAIASSVPQFLSPMVASIIILNFGYAFIFPVATTLCLIAAVLTFFIRSVR